MLIGGANQAHQSIRIRNFRNKLTFMDIFLAARNESQNDTPGFPMLIGSTYVYYESIYQQIECGLLLILMIGFH